MNSDSQPHVRMYPLTTNSKIFAHLLVTMSGVIVFSNGDIWVKANASIKPGLLSRVQTDSDWISVTSREEYVQRIQYKLSERKMLESQREADESKELELISESKKLLLKPEAVQSMNVYYQLKSNYEELIQNTRSCINIRNRLIQICDDELNHLYSELNSLYPLNGMLASQHNYNLVWEYSVE